MTLLGVLYIIENKNNKTAKMRLINKFPHIRSFVINKALLFD